MNKEKNLKYPVKRFRIHNETYRKLAHYKRKSKLTWNKFFIYILKLLEKHL